MRDQVLREWVELLDAHDGRALVGEFFSLGDQIVIDLPAAEQNPAHARGPLRALVSDDGPKPAARQLFNRGSGFGKAEQALGRYQNERLAYVLPRLAAQHMKILSGGRAVDHLHVLLRAELQEPLDARARMLGPLPFIPVGQ